MPHRNHLNSSGAMNVDAKSHPEIDSHVLLEPVSLQIDAERIRELPFLHLHELALRHDRFLERVGNHHAVTTPELDLETGAIQAPFRIPAQGLVRDADQIGKV